MRIGIDTTFLFDQYASRGIGTYAREIIARMIEDTNHTWVLFGYKNLKDNLNKLGVNKNKQISFCSLGKPVNSSPLNILRFKLRVKRKIKQEKLDVYFAPHFERGLPIGIVKTCVMVHDVIPYATGKYSQKGTLHNALKGIFYRYNLKKAKKADLVLTNSDFSRRELIQKAGFKEEKTERIHLGIDENFRQKKISSDARDVRRVLLMYKISTPYILYYGGFESNKNVPSLILAFKNLITRFPDMKLVLTGKEFKVGWDNKPKPQNPAAKQILELIEDNKLKHYVIITGEVDKIHLPIVLKNASVFVHLSTYEGFGFSVLEAAAAGVPIVAPRRSSYPEILDETPAFVNPDEPTDVSEAIQSIIEDEQKNKTMVKKGLKVAERFDWNVSATKTKEKLLELAGTISPLKIAYLSTYFHPFKGGAENNCLEIALRASKAGHKVEVLTGNLSEDPQAETEEFSGISIRRFKRLNRHYYATIYPRMLIHLLRNRYDLIHVHGFGFIWHDIMLILKKIFSRSVLINTPHGPFMALNDYSLPQKIIRMFMNTFQSLYLNWLYRGVIQVNPQQIRWLKRYRINPKKIFYLPNGISKEYLEDFDNSSFLKKYKLKSKFVISFVGRFEKYKGLEDVIYAIADLLHELPDLVLIAIGRKGDYFEHIENLIKEMNLEKNVILLPEADDSTKQALLESSEIFIMSSQWEAFGISILEAMARKNVIISTRTEGGEFLIKEGQNGLLYDFGDRKELRKHIEYFYNNKENREEIKKNNHLKAKEFCWDEIAKEYLEYIKQITK